MLLEINYQVTTNFLKTSFAKLVSRIRSDLWEKYQARELNKLFKQSLLLCVDRDAFVVGWVRKVSFLWHRHCITHCLIPIPAAKKLLHFVFKLIWAAQEILGLSIVRLETTKARVLAFSPFHCHKLFLRSGMISWNVEVIACILRLLSYTKLCTVAHCNNRRTL